MAGGIIYDDNISRQGSESLMAERINENLNQAIDIIISKKIESLAFDKTEVCLIEKQDGDEYTVNNGSISYKARSSGGKYSPGQKVYVSIPNNDYENIKTITGLCADTNLNADNYYVNIFDSFIDITGDIFDNKNIIDNTDIDIVKERSVNLTANWKDNSVKYILSKKTEDLDNDWVKFKKPMCGYDVFAISFKLDTRMHNVIKGTFGIKIELYGSTKEGENEYKIYSFEKTSNTIDGYSDFSGNPYSYGTPVTQQFRIDIADIEDLKIILGARIFVFQNNDFETNDGLLTYSTEEEPIPNIYFNDFKIDFGKYPDNDGSFADSLVLSSPDSYYYTRTDEKESFTRTINLNWIHNFNQTEDTNTSIPIVLNSKEDFNTYRITDQLSRVKISWYEWKDVASEEIDINTGRFWKKLSTYYWLASTGTDGLLEGGSWLPENSEDPFSYTVNIEPNTNSVTYKVFIEYGLNVEYLEDGPTGDVYTAVESSEITFYATVPKADSLRGRDLIEGLYLSVDDNSKGQYYLYDSSTNQLSSSVEKNRIRTITAVYAPAEFVGDSFPPFPKNSSIYWKIPIIDTLLSFLLPDSTKYQEVESDSVEIFKIFGEETDSEIYKYYKRIFSEEEEKDRNIDFLQYTIKEDYAFAQRENTVECKLLNNKDEQICGGKMNFFFTFQPSVKTVIDPYWAETYIWEISGNATGEKRGTIEKSYKTTLVRPEALPVGGWLNRDKNYRFATKIGLKIYDYSGNPLFTTENRRFTDLQEYLSNATVQMGTVYDKKMNFSVGENGPLLKINGENELKVNGNAFISIEGQSDATDTGTNLAFYNDELYYISPLGTRTSTNNENDTDFLNPWVYGGEIAGAWPEVINFKTEKDGEKISATLPIHFVRMDMNGGKVFSDITELKDGIELSPQYNLVSGADLVVYDENGTLMSGTASDYKLAGMESGCDWKIWYLKKNGQNNYVAQKDDTGKYFRFINGYLQHMADSLPIERAFFVSAEGGDTVYYKMPLRIIQKQYGLSLLKDWDGTNAPTIFGEQNDGTFSGVFSGYNSIQRYKDNEQLVKEDDSKEEKEKEVAETPSYGFFGYENGYSTFALQNEDPYFTVKGLVKDADQNIVGQSTIFQAGRNSLFLRSMNYKKPTEENLYSDGRGMEINLVEGTINSHDVDSVLYAKEIGILTAVQTAEAEEAQVITKIDQEGINISKDGNETAITQNSVSTNQVTSTNLTVMGSSSIQNTGEKGIFINDEDVTLIGATLKGCILEGDFEAERATIKGVTIENGSIKWNEENNLDGQIENVNKIIFSGNNSSITGLETISTDTIISSSITGLNKITFSGENPSITGLKTITTNTITSSNITGLNKITFSGENPSITGLSSLEATSLKTGELIINEKELKQVSLPLIEVEEEDGSKKLVFNKEATDTSEYVDIWVFV